MRQTVVPFRNGIMLAVAGGYAESIGARAWSSPPMPETMPFTPIAGRRSCRPWETRSGWGPTPGSRFLRPFIHATKAQSRVAPTPRRGLSQTWSCYKGGAIHCGACGTCVERREAFLLAGMADPTLYAETAALPPKPV